jgi:hypothetical protein
MATFYNPNSVVDGLVFAIDAANIKSYSGTGFTVNGLVGGIGGTLVNGTGFTSSNYGSFIFDGTNDYIEVPDSNLLAFGTNPFTIDFWLYSTYVYPGSGIIYRTILSNYLDYQGVYATYFYLGLYNNGSTLNNFISFLNSSSGNLMGSLGANINSNEWTNVTFTRNGNNLVCYKNGVSVSTVVSTNNFSGTRNARVGGGVISVNTFQGSFPSFKIYNRVLSAQEILQNFNAMRGRYGI